MGDVFGGLKEVVGGGGCVEEEDNEDDKGSAGGGVMLVWDCPRSMLTRPLSERGGAGGGGGGGGSVCAEEEVNGSSIMVAMVSVPPLFASSRGISSSSCKGKEDEKNRSDFGGAPQENAKSTHLVDV